MLHDIDAYPAPSADGSRKRLSELPFIHPGAVVERSRIGSWTEVGRNSRIVESTIGDYTYDDGEVSIVYSEVGRYCSIANRVRINPGNHPMDRVTQHHMTYRRAQFGLAETDDPEFFDWRRDHRCIIGHDVWIGHAAIILAGLRIGTGAVIAAGAVVTRDVEPYQIVAGVPARPKRKRFEDAVIRGLLRSEWWEWSREELVDRWRDLCSVSGFLEKYGH